MAIAMTTTPPSVPPTAGAVTELCSNPIQSEMIEMYLRPTEQERGPVMEEP
jgi:hypothetical protein